MESTDVDVTPVRRLMAAILEEGLAIRTSQVITVIVMLVTVTFVFWFLQKTRTGKSMRAYSDNEDLALLSGISPDRVVMITWALAIIAFILTRPTKEVVLARAATFEPPPPS